MSTSLASKTLPRSTLNSIHLVLDEHIAYKANGKGRCSDRTIEHRRGIILLTYAQLWILGFHLGKATSLRAKHIKAIMDYWVATDVSASMLHTRLSVLRIYAGWIGKQEIVGDLTEYVDAEHAKRTTIAQQDRSWKGNGIDALAIIAKARDVDERFGAILYLQLAFGLRAKEAIQIRPSHCLIDAGESIEVFEGTKGGRPRHVPIETWHQAEALRIARDLALTGKTARLRWTNLTWKQSQRRYYYLLRKIGVTKAQLGVTGHGLRHEFAQDKYTRDTGCLTPIQGGDPKALSREAHRIASYSTSSALGHGRIDVTASYYGSHGHAQRPVKMPVTMKYKLPS